MILGLSLLELLRLWDRVACLLQRRVLHALVATAPMLMALHANLARELSTASPANAKSVLRLT